MNNKRNRTKHTHTHTIIMTLPPMGVQCTKVKDQQLVLPTPRYCVRCETNRQQFRSTCMCRHPSAICHIEWSTLQTRNMMICSCQNTVKRKSVPINFESTQN